MNTIQIIKNNNCNTGSSRFCKLSNPPFLLNWFDLATQQMGQQENPLKNFLLMVIHREELYVTPSLNLFFSLYS